MARGNEIRYVRFYTDGSAAPRLEPKGRPEQQPVQRPHLRRKKRIVLRVDFVAVAGILTAGVMLILMLAGAVRLSQAGRAVVQLEDAVAQLENEQRNLKQAYESACDLEEIRTQALEMGLIPAEEAEMVPIQIGEQEKE